MILRMALVFAVGISSTSFGENIDSNRKFPVSVLLNGIANTCAKVGSAMGAETPEEKQQAVMTVISSVFSLVGRVTEEQEKDRRERKSETRSLSVKEELIIDALVLEIIEDAIMLEVCKNIAVRHAEQNVADCDTDKSDYSLGWVKELVVFAKKFWSHEHPMTYLSDQCSLLANRVKEKIIRFLKGEGLGELVTGDSVSCSNCPEGSAEEENPVSEEEVLLAIEEEEVIEEACE